MMAFTPASLYQVGPGGVGPRLWMYASADAIATVVAVDYFLTNAVPHIGMALNDIIFVISSTGGTPAVTITYVNAVSATSIDVVDGLLVPATDT